MPGFLGGIGGGWVLSERGVRGERMPGDRGPEEGDLPPGGEAARLR